MEDIVLKEMTMWKKPQMNVLFVCTSNKDRSPALEKYFSETYPQHTYKSAGVNKYFCGKKGTTYLSVELLSEADIIVFAEDIHYSIAKRDFSEGVSDNGMVIKYTWNNKNKHLIICLNLGDYEQGNINEDYLLRADNTIGWALTNQ